MSSLSPNRAAALAARFECTESGLGTDLAGDDCQTMHRTRIEAAAVGNGAGDPTDGAGERHGGR